MDVTDFGIEKTTISLIVKDTPYYGETNYWTSRSRLEDMHAEHGAHASQEQIYKAQEDNDSAAIKEDIVSLDSGNTASGILEVMADGFGFIRCENYLPGEHDVYVAPSQIRRFNLKTGDIVCGNTKVKSEREKFSALLYVTSVNGYHPSEAQKRTNF